MAQVAKIGKLTEELVLAITDFDARGNARAYRQARDFAKSGIRAHYYTRTNQFEVEASLKGLDEEFRVLDRDDLADAFKERVEELQNVRNKWTPELLSLLLLLSDRPIENSHVEDLELLKPPPSPVPLTWAQILEEDGLDDDDKELWRDIDYAEESSEDEHTPAKNERVKRVAETRPSSVEEDLYDPQASVVPVDANRLAKFENAQFWRHKPEDETGKVNITELQAIRETLFMLAGLQSSVYIIDSKAANVRVAQKFNLAHAIPRTANDLLSQFSDIGRNLYQLRVWTARTSSLPLIQTFEASVRKKLNDFDKFLALLQKRYLVPEMPISVSLLKLHDEVRTYARPLLALAQLVADIEPELYINPFAHLEVLFDRINLAHMTLENDVFDFLGEIFFDCLQTYLKPIRRWMEDGELGANDETFFVFESDSSSEASSLWHDRYVLRRGRENALRSPKFLRPTAQKIFNTGKSIVFLSELNVDSNTLSTSATEPRLDLEAVCGARLDGELPLSPFSDLFDAAFDNWIKSKYSLASTVLREQLFSECGLLRILDVFKHLFLAADGSVFHEFADAIFQRVDTRRAGWNDRYLLTELARGIFSPVLGSTEAERIVVRSNSTKNDSHSVKCLGSVAVDYAMPWSIMNIIQRQSIPIYQHVSSFLLQIYRAKYLLQNVQWKSISQIGDRQQVQLSYKLRHRLIWLTDIFHSYLTDTVFAPSIEDMISSMVKAEDIDDMSTIHLKYVARLQEQALLSSNLKPIHRAVISLLDLCALYADIHSPSVEEKKVPTSSDSMPSPKKSKNRRKSIIPTIQDDASSDSEEGGDFDADTASSAENGGSLAENLQRIEGQFDQLLHFVTAGLRSVSRAGGEPCWEMLAERLEWNRSRVRV